MTITDDEIQAPRRHAGQDDGDDAFDHVYVFAAVAILILVFGIGFGLGLEYMGGAMHREAVQRGKAEWVPDERGEPVWRWKP